jgi:hypothetical protein
LIYSSQTVFQARNDRFAASLAELAEGDRPLIDEDLADGEKNGYHYETEQTTIGFRARAHPAALCETGRRFFYVDQTGALATRVCQADGPLDDVPPFMTPEWPPESENCRCPRSGDVSRPMVTQLRLLSPIDFLREAELWSASSKNVDLTLLALDRNSDKQLGLDEIVDADILAVARKLAADSKLPGGPAIGSDRDLTEALSRFRAALEAKLLLGAGDEENIASVPIQGLKGDAGKWLQSAPKLPIGSLSDQSTRALRELTNLAVAENLAVLRTGACTNDVRSLWAIAPALRIAGDRYGYDYGVETCDGNQWSIFALAHGESAKRPSFRIDESGQVNVKP